MPAFTNFLISGALYLAQESPPVENVAFRFTWWGGLLVLFGIILGVWLLMLAQTRYSPSEYLEREHFEEPEHVEELAHAPVSEQVGLETSIAEETKPEEPEILHAPGHPAPVEPAPAVPLEEDLTIIEGIGPKIAALLKEHEIATFEQLAETEVDELDNLLDDAGLHMINAHTWPEQARLAHEKKWAELEALQAELKGGREV